MPAIPQPGSPVGQDALIRVPLPQPVAPRASAPPVAAAPSNTVAVKPKSVVSQSYILPG